MAGMDVFAHDGFTTMSMLGTVDKLPYVPQFLGSLNLFSSQPQDTRLVTIESRDNALTLIKTSADGAPPEQAANENPRELRSFRTVRLAKADKLQASEISGIRAFGTMSELEQVQERIARKQARLRQDMELTHEFHRLGAIQGVVLDADGSTLVNYNTAFGTAAPASVPFDFEAADPGDFRAAVEGSIVRPLVRAGGGTFIPGMSYVMALCGDAFWDAMINCEEVRATYLATQQAADLRKATAYGTFTYAGVTWVNYRGTDDNSTVAVNTNQARFFPVAAPGVFQVAWGPGEFLDVVNQPGVPVLPKVLPDPSGRQAFVNVELYSYPLFVCTRPLMLRTMALDD